MAIITKEEFLAKAKARTKPLTAEEFIQRVGQSFSGAELTAITEVVRQRISIEPIGFEEQNKLIRAGLAKVLQRTDVPRESIRFGVSKPPPRGRVNTAKNIYST